MTSEHNVNITILDVSDNKVLHEGFMTKRLFESVSTDYIQVKCSVFHLPSNNWPSPSFLNNNTDGIIVTGAFCSANDTQGLPWLSPLERLVHRCVAGELPCVFLGICFGAQLLARVVYGDSAFVVMDEPEIGIISVYLNENSDNNNNNNNNNNIDNTQDPLFQNIKSPFCAVVSHFDGFQHPDLKSTARTPYWDHHAFRVGKRCFGVQFHPEIKGSEFETIVHHVIGENDPRVKREHSEPDYNVGQQIAKNWIHFIINNQ